MNWDEIKNFDIKNVDLKDLSSLPLPVKLIGIGLGCVLILVAGYFALIKSERETLESLGQTELQLRDEFLAKKAKAINLPAYKTQMEEMERTFGTMRLQLPSTTEVPNLLIDITQAGLGRGLEFVTFKPEKEKPVDFYAELPISIKVNGTYHELAQFASDVSALPRIVTLGDVAIGSDARSAKLTMSVTAKTYRYLEEGQAQPAKNAPGRKGPNAR